MSCFAPPSASTGLPLSSLSQSSVGGRGTLPFKAPELFTHPPVASEAADVYAFAILSWIVVTRELPYTTMVSASTALPMAVLDGVRPTLASGDDWKDGVKGGLTKLIESCWEGERETRPPFSHAREQGIVAVLEELELSMAKDEQAHTSMVHKLIMTVSDAQELEQRHDTVGTHGVGAHVQS